MNPDPRSTEAAFGLGTQEVKRRHILLKALLVGVVAGVLASTFRIALQFSERHRIAWQHDSSGPIGLTIAVGIGGVGAGLAVWLVRRFAPEAAGSGIPHLKAVVLGERQMTWRRLLPVKFLAGVLGIGSGLALGREGPTIQMGGSTGIMVSEWFKIRPGEGERRALISAGAGAGLAAAFNAPLAGLIFVLEELQGNFTPVVFVAAFLASVTADVVSRVLIGENPVFPLHQMPAPTVHAVPLALLLGVFCGLAGVLFNRTLLKTLDVFEKTRRWPPYLVGGAVGVMVGFASWMLPGVAGSGGTIVERSLAGEVATEAVLGLLALRFALTMISYGCGAAGGIFAPLLVLGALGGLALGRVVHGIAPEWAAQPEIFAVLGMGALLTAIVRAPLTGIVLMVELTGKYDFMLPLLASCLVAYGVAEGLRDVPIYEALRQRATERVGKRG
ncbi:MAG: H(+)/Cl(-) exchange transporter ClcA [Opitutus sp.]